MLNEEEEERERESERQREQREKIKTKRGGNIVEREREIEGITGRVFVRVN